MKPACLTLAILCVLLLTGCTSPVERRIQENATLFNSLDGLTQFRIKTGIIEKGYSEQMVFIALGTPDQKSEKITSTGKETTWTYSDVSGTSGLNEPPEPVVHNATHTRPEAVIEHRDIERNDLWTHRTVIFKDGKVISYQLAQKS